MNFYTKTQLNLDVKEGQVVNKRPAWWYLPTFVLSVFLITFINIRVLEKTGSIKKKLKYYD